ncbi:MAG: response regulator, partial [Myxococcota bacterium]
MPRILLVDDDPELTVVIGEFLVQNGFDVEEASDGPSALAAVARDPPDLVILDVMMAGMDGLAVCRALRPSYDGRILLLTALVDDIDEVAGLETGADDYLRKPVRPRVLLAR